MLRLAIDIGGSDRQGELTECLVPFRRLDAPELVRHVGTSVLVYVPAGAGNLFVGSAVLGGIVPQAPGSPQLAAQLTKVMGFAEPIEQPAYGRMDAVPWISLPSALFETILSAGTQGRGFDEAATPFVHAGADAPVPELATYEALRRAVLRNYGHACAMTGVSASGRAGALGEPEVVPIRPRPQGGPVHVTNCISLAPAAGDALNHGHITVTDDYRLVADLSRIDPELLEHLNPDGRLRVPEDVALRPARAHLAWHRERLLEGTSEPDEPTDLAP